MSRHGPVPDPERGPASIRDRLYREQIARNQELERRARRSERVFWLVTLVVCWLWCLAGGAVLVWALHTTDEQAGKIALDASWGIAAGGTLLTIVVALGMRRRRGYD